MGLQNMKWDLVTLVTSGGDWAPIWQSDAPLCPGPAARSASSSLFGALLAIWRLLGYSPSLAFWRLRPLGVLLLVTWLPGPISHLACRGIPNYSVPSWVFDTLLVVRRPSDHWGSSYHSIFLSGDRRGVSNPKDWTYPECSYARYVTVWDPLSDPPTVPVRSSILTDWSGSQKCAENPGEHLSQEVEGKPGECRVAKRTLSLQGWCCVPINSGAWNI